MPQQVTVPLTWQLAPTSLTQPILPNWQFHLFNVNLGASSNPAVEQAALARVGSYGRQIGHLAEALELVVRRLKLLESKDLTPEEKDVLQVFLGDVSTIRQIKASDVAVLNGSGAGQQPIWSARCSRSLACRVLAATGDTSLMCAAPNSSGRSM